MNDRLQVLFLCTGNSCRSQMAEGLCRHLRGDVIEPRAVRVMSEIGIVITNHRSKKVGDLGDARFDDPPKLAEGDADEMSALFEEVPADPKRERPGKNACT